MAVIRSSLNSLWDAMFLNPQPYEEMAAGERPVQRGLIILIMLGLLLALANLIGSTLTWLTSPDLANIQNVVLSSIQQMNWWPFIEQNPQVLQIWSQIWQSIWSIIGAFTRTPLNALPNFITQPLGLVISWLVFGVAAHLAARLFGGRGTLGQTLGATSLAQAPQLLGLITAVPYVSVFAVGIWVLLARYMAVRVAHSLSWGRAVWVVFLATLAIFIIILLLVGGSALVGYSMFGKALGGG